MMHWKLGRIKWQAFENAPRGPSGFATLACRRHLLHDGHDRGCWQCHRDSRDGQIRDTLVDDVPAANSLPLPKNHLSEMDQTSPFHFSIAKNLLRRNALHAANLRRIGPTNLNNPCTKMLTRG